MEDLVSSFAKKHLIDTDTAKGVSYARKLREKARKMGCNLKLSELEERFLDIAEENLSEEWL